MSGINGQIIFLVEYWAVEDRIPSTRAVIFPSSQTPWVLSQLCAAVGLAQSFSTELIVGSDIPEDESDVDCDLPEELSRYKINRERRTDSYNVGPALFNFFNRSSCLRQIPMD